LHTIIKEATKQDFISWSTYIGCAVVSSV